MIRFAVVGTGWVAKEYMKAIRSNREAELYAVVTGDAERAGNRLAELGMEARIYTNYEEMIKEPNIDAVILCSTPDVRPDQAKLAARNGKHLVLEKPLAMNMEAMRQMAPAIEESGITAIASFVLRWNPAIEMIRALIRDDVVGRIFMAQIDYWNHIGPQFPQYRWSTKTELGGSSMLSAGCHAVDALRYFAGDIVEVTAYSCATRADSDYEFDPNVIALFKLKNGGIGKVSSSLECRTPYKFNIHLLGDKGTIMNNRVFSDKFPGQTDFATFPVVLPESGDVSHQPFEMEIAEFVEAVQTKRPTRCDFKDAYKSMEVCFAIDRSIATGEKISLEA